MSGFELYVDWDDERFQQLLNAIANRVDDMSPVMADFSEYMIAETMERFDKEEAPDGTGWQVLSDVTKKMRAEAGKSGKILQVDGILRSSIQGNYDGSGAGLSSTNVEYAAIQNFGGLAGWNLSVEIPERQYMGFSEDDIDYFEESVGGWIVTGEVG